MDWVGQLGFVHDEAFGEQLTSLLSTSFAESELARTGMKTWHMHVGSSAALGTHHLDIGPTRDNSPDKKLRKSRV